MAQFASESFTGTEGAELAAHNASFTKCPSLTGAIEIASNRGRCTSTTSPGYYHSGAPASADYQVTADLTKVSAAVSFLGVIGRQSTSANTCYRCTVDPTVTSTVGTLQLFKFVAGTATQLGSSTSVDYVTADTRQIKLEMVGSAIKAYWDGSGSPTISVTDTAISAAGKAGVRGFSSAAPSDSVGGHITNFSADDIVSGVTITGTPGDAVAAGTSATVNQARAVTGTTGNAAAAGITAQINQARTVTGSVGNAVSAGVTATVNRATSIAATPGNAVAAGVAATITAAGAVVITGTPGNAAAAGVSASINQARSVTGTAGNAVAAGVQATISTAGAGVTITATPGNAFASGPQAIIVRNVAIAAAVGNAVAAGRQATVSNITATDDLYPLEGMSQDYPLQGMTQTYPLAGQTPS